jgi:hypothetical protein
MAISVIYGVGEGLEPIKPQIFNDSSKFSGVNLQELSKPVQTFFDSSVFFGVGIQLLAQEYPPIINISYSLT